MHPSPCPYCGHTPETPDTTRCTRCGGLFEPLSRKATQLAMGPWFVRDEDRPFMPGFSEAILRHQVASGRIKADTIVRGPTTNQFWSRADQAPGLSRLLGKCHACGGTVEQDATTCNACHTDLSLPNEIDRLGLAYVNPLDRQQAQDEVNTQRTAPPPKAAPAKPKQPETVSSDLLEDIDHEHDEQPVQPVGGAAGHDDPANDIVDDLWQSDTPLPTTSRRRKKKNEPDPVILGLGVLFLCFVGIGLFVLVSSMDTGDDDTADANQPPPRVERTANDVTRLSGPIDQTFEALNEAEVPEPFKERMNEAASLISKAKRNVEREAFTDAYDQFAEAQTLLENLPDEIEKWEAEQAAKAEATALLGAVTSLQAKAQQAEAEKWSKMWSAGEAALGLAKVRLDKGEYESAVEKLDEAKQAYQEALGASEAAAQAQAANKVLIEAMENSLSEETLRRHASASIDRLNALRETASEKFNNRKYAEARGAYEDALDALRAAEQAVELAKYRKFYAYRAGHRAAGMLLAIAAGDGIEAEALKALMQSFDELSLPDNPAVALKPGQDADYAQAAERLVNAARSAITERHGEEVQASYHAGFQIRIVEQTLTTLALTDAQKKRIHQSLDIFQEQAVKAGWDASQLRAVVDKVRTANRTASLGKPPDLTREAFAVLIKPLSQQHTAARLMDPQLTPSTPQDPELFPGLGSSRP